MNKSAGVIAYASSKLTIYGPPLRDKREIEIRCQAFNQTKFFFLIHKLQLEWHQESIKI